MSGTHEWNPYLIGHIDDLGGMAASLSGWIGREPVPGTNATVLGFDISASAHLVNISGGNGAFRESSRKNKSKEKWNASAYTYDDHRPEGIGSELEFEIRTGIVKSWRALKALQYDVLDHYGMLVDDFNEAVPGLLAVSVQPMGIVLPMDIRDGDRLSLGSQGKFSWAYVVRRGDAPEVPEGTE